MMLRFFNIWFRSYCIVVLFSTSVECQDKIIGKEDYLKNIQTQNSDFDCLKKCVRPPSASLYLEPTQSEKDPRPLITNCNDREIHPSCKNVINLSNTPLVNADDGKYFFPKTPQSMTWHAAWRQCRSFNLQLLSVFSESLLRKLGDAMFAAKMTGTYWSSGILLSNGDLVWAETGNPIVWSTVMQGATAPKKAPNTCISINYDTGAKKIKLNEEPCSKTLSFICEVPDECFANRCV